MQIQRSTSVPTATQNSLVQRDEDDGDEEQSDSERDEYLQEHMLSFLRLWSRGKSDYRSSPPSRYGAFARHEDESYQADEEKPATKRAVSDTSLYRRDTDKEVPDISRSVSVQVNRLMAHYKETTAELSRVNEASYSSGEESEHDEDTKDEVREGALTSTADEDSASQSDSSGSAASSPKKAARVATITLVTPSEQSFSVLVSPPSRQEQSSPQTARSATTGNLQTPTNLMPSALLVRRKSTGSVSLSPVNGSRSRGGVNPSFRRVVSAGQSPATPTRPGLGSPQSARQHLAVDVTRAQVQSSAPNSARTFSLPWPFG